MALGFGISAHAVGFQGLPLLAAVSSLPDSSEALPSEGAERIQHFVMIPPHFEWGLDHAGNNYKETESRGQPRNPQEAFSEWLTIAETIEDAGGRVYVMEPDMDIREGSTDMVYAANSGDLIVKGGEAVFAVANMKFPERQIEAPQLKRWWEDLELRVEELGPIWEGQADISRGLLLPDGTRKFIFTHGVRTVEAALDEIGALYGKRDKFLAAQITNLDFFHGDTCFNLFPKPAGGHLALYAKSAFSVQTLGAMRTFLGESVEFIGLEEHDAKVAYAANTLEVGGHLLMLGSASRWLVDLFERIGFVIDFLSLPQLFGKGGGGSRCSVLEIPKGIEVTGLLERLAPYRFNRNALEARLTGYHTEVFPSTSGTLFPELT